MNNLNPLFPFNSQIAYHNYPQLEFPWVILYQTVNKETSQLLDRRLSFLNFLKFSKVEIINKSLFNEDFEKISDFYYMIERYVENINYSSRYTWTIDNSKDDKDQYNDPEWLFNKYKGWERSKTTYLHSGKYLPVNVGFINWGSLSPIIVNSKISSTNLTDPITSKINLKFSINTSIGTISNDLLDNTENNSLILNTYPIKVSQNNNRTIYILPLGDLAYATKFNNISSNVECYWTNAEGSLEIPVLKNSVEVIRYTHLKIIVPTVITANTVADKDVYSSIGYLDVNIYGYKIYQTINLTNPIVEQSTYELYSSDTSVDLSDPWPNYPKVSISLENYLT